MEVLRLSEALQQKSQMMLDHSLQVAASKVVADQLEELAKDEEEREEQKGAMDFAGLPQDVDKRLDDIRARDNKIRKLKQDMVGTLPTYLDMELQRLKLEFDECVEVSKLNELFKQIHARSEQVRKSLRLVKEEESMELVEPNRKQKKQAHIDIVRQRAEELALKAESDGHNVKSLEDLTAKLIKTSRRELLPNSIMGSVKGPMRSMMQALKNSIIPKSPSMESIGMALRDMKILGGAKLSNVLGSDYNIPCWKAICEHPHLLGAFQVMVLTKHEKLGCFTQRCYNAKTRSKIKLVFLDEGKHFYPVSWREFEPLIQYFPNIDDIILPMVKREYWQIRGAPSSYEYFGKMV